MLQHKQQGESKYIEKSLEGEKNFLKENANELDC